MAAGSQPGERAACAAFLKSYSDALQRLMDLLGKRHDITQGELAEVREGYRSVKERFKADYHRLSKGEARGELNATEVAFVVPAIHKAMTKLRPATNTHPLNSNWFSAIYDAAGDIDYMLRQLTGE